MECNAEKGERRCGLPALSVRFSSRHGVQLGGGRQSRMIEILSVRFSSRHGVQLFILEIEHDHPLTFSPLFIAAWSATKEKWYTRDITFTAFSPLFIAAWSATKETKQLNTKALCFQSAFHRGMECNYSSTGTSLGNWASFSPLFIAAWSATVYPTHLVIDMRCFQSAFHRGMECNNLSTQSLVYVIISFSPLFIAAWSATKRISSSVAWSIVSFSPLFIAAWSATQKNGSSRNIKSVLSVRFSSRHGVQLA